MTEALLQTNQIMGLLPHAHPWVLIDRVIELVPGERIKGIKCVSFSEPWFAAHFPGFPILPGVLIIEAMAQLAGLLASQSQGNAETGSTDPNEAPKKQPAVVLLLGVDGAKFRRPVTPGEVLELSCEVLQRRSDVWRVRAEATVENKRVAQAELILGGSSMGDRLKQQGAEVRR